MQTDQSTTYGCFTPHTRSCACVGLHFSMPHVHSEACHHRSSNWCITLDLGECYDHQNEHVRFPFSVTSFRQIFGPHPMTVGPARNLWMLDHSGQRGQLTLLLLICFHLAEEIRLHFIVSGSRCGSIWGLATRSTVSWGTFALKVRAKIQVQERLQTVRRGRRRR